MVVRYTQLSLSARVVDEAVRSEVFLAAQLLSGSEVSQEQKVNPAQAYRVLVTPVGPIAQLVRASDS